MSGGSTKVHPVLDIDEEAHIAQLGQMLQPKFTTKSSFRNTKQKGRQSFDYSAKTPTSAAGDVGGGKHFSSSFISMASEADSMDAGGVTLEMVINFLTLNLDNVVADSTYMKEFEELSHEMLKNSRDPELPRILKSHGWTGSRYKATNLAPLDLHSLLQDFSNLYLRYKVSAYTTHITSLYEAGNAQATDQIFSFIPDTLLYYLSTLGESVSASRLVSPRHTHISTVGSTSPGAAGCTDGEGNGNAAVGASMRVTATGSASAGNSPIGAGHKTLIESQSQPYLPNHHGASSPPSSSTPTGAAQPLTLVSPRAAVTSPRVTVNANGDIINGNGILSPRRSHKASPRNSSNMAAHVAAVAAAHVRSITFTGACMLADISGFSKFSGAMCSKGVSGLDDLREATNGFLGHIVKIVYDFHGDGELLILHAFLPDRPDV
jgi:hypothetical protein